MISKQISNISTNWRKYRAGFMSLPLGNTNFWKNVEYSQKISCLMSILTQ